MAPVRPNPTLSEDLISEILVRVPVKSLLCFQSVSKTWLSLIKHPAFVKSQLRHAITTQTDQTLIIGRKYSQRKFESTLNHAVHAYRSSHKLSLLQYVLYRGQKFSLLHADSRQIVSDLKDLKAPCSPGELVCPPTLAGSANGIVCVKASMPTHKRRSYIWNPATRQYKLIPRFDKCSFQSSPSEFGYDPLGFGYDPIDDEYKVVSFGGLESNSVEVYLANRDVWRKASNQVDISSPIDIPSSGVFDVCINGYLCGIGVYGMVVFDLHKEFLNWAIKVPVIIRYVHDDDEVDGWGDDETRIIEFNKSIAVITLWDKGRNDGKMINMWMLDDDTCLGGGGVEASWTPMFSIDLVDSEYPTLTLGYLNDRDLLVLTDEMWISCNVDKKEAKIVPLSVEMAGHDYDYDNSVYKYTESLVSLPGFKQIDWNDGEDDNLGKSSDFDISVK